MSTHTLPQSVILHTIKGSQIILRDTQLLQTTRGLLYKFMRRQWIICNATLQLRYNMSYTFIGADEKSSHQSGLRAVFRTIILEPNLY